MSQEQKFFICKHCGNLVGMIHNAGVKIICCGEPMTERRAKSTCLWSRCPASRSPSRSGAFRIR